MDALSGTTVRNTNAPRWSASVCHSMSMRRSSIQWFHSKDSATGRTWRYANNSDVVTRRSHVSLASAGSCMQLPSMVIKFAPGGVILSTCNHIMYICSPHLGKTINLEQIYHSHFLEPTKSGILRLKVDQLRLASAGRWKAWRTY